MTVRDPALIRGVILFLPLALAFGLWQWRRPDRCLGAGAFLASSWMLTAGLAIHVVAVRAGFWRYEAHGAVWLGLPVDVYLGWAVFWGAVPVLAFRRTNVALVVVAMALADLVLMPAAFPVVRLGPNWLAGEAIALLIGAIPAYLLGRWTADGVQLAWRTLLQGIAFSGLALGVLPAAILTRTGGSLPMVDNKSTGYLAVGLQVVALIAIVGLSAVQEFVQRGRGTPFPWDPPERMVTTGPYAYLANPMQASMTLLMLAVGVIGQSWWVAAAAVVAAVFSSGLAAWHEDGELTRRFGPAWDHYRAEVRPWLPRWRPAPGSGETARLYFAETCTACSGLARWLRTLQPLGLQLLPAEDLAPQPRRLTYIGTDGVVDIGVRALGRALEHVNLSLAFIGWTVRLPVVGEFAQLVTDAVGGGPRELSPQSPSPLREG
jgi:protein-S-isoprenylcysteine O-methyltransferase Ste14